MNDKCHQLTMFEAQVMARYVMAWRGQSLLLLGNEGELDGSGIWIGFQKKSNQGTDIKYGALSGIRYNRE